MSSALHRRNGVRGFSLYRIFCLPCCFRFLACNLSCLSRPSFFGSRWPTPLGNTNNTRACPLGAIAGMPCVMACSLHIRYLDHRSRRLDCLGGFHVYLFASNFLRPNTTIPAAGDSRLSEPVRGAAACLVLRSIQDIYIRLLNIQTEKTPRSSCQL
ncbi:hypothetical protein VTK26DRAFT_4612 [Humicola hyalothermophila]